MDKTSLFLNSEGVLGPSAVLLADKLTIPVIPSYAAALGAHHVGLNKGLIYIAFCM